MANASSTKSDGFALRRTGQSDGAKSWPGTAPEFRRRIPVQTTSDELPKSVLTNPCSRCRTASPVAVRHFLLRGPRGEARRERAAGLLARRAVRSRPTGRCCGTTRSCTPPTAARPGSRATQHRASLADFLGARGFLKDVVPTSSRRTGSRSGDGGSAADGRHRPVGLEERRVVDAVAGTLGRHRDHPALGDLLVGRRRRAAPPAGRTPRGRTGSCGPGRRR